MGKEKKANKNEKQEGREGSFFDAPC